MRILTITTADIGNGVGCRVTLWVAGCSHHCPGCHNPETWDYNQGEEIEKVYSYLDKELSKDYISGLTLSGGDPLAQSDESLKQLLDLCKYVKEKYPSKNIWIWAGELFEDLCTQPLKKEILTYCDVLVDGPFILEKRNTHIAFRGSTNQRIIDLKKSLEHITPIEYVIK